MDCRTSPLHITGRALSSSFEILDFAMCLFDGILVRRANLNNRCKRSERRVAIGIVVRLFGTTDGVRDPAELVTNSAGSRTPLLGGASGRDLPRPAGQWQSSGHWKIIGKHGRLLWIFKYSQELGNSNNCRGDWPPCFTSTVPTVPR